MEASEFFSLLEKHDWFYQYSDDHRAWEKGSTESKRLQAIIQENDMFTRMYLTYSDYMFKPLDEREGLERPQLKDFLS
jgi:hypothetical protein